MQDKEDRPSRPALSKENFEHFIGVLYRFPSSVGESSEINLNLVKAGKKHS
jgi:hypothetical protein